MIVGGMDDMVIVIRSYGNFGDDDGDMVKQ